MKLNNLSKIELYTCFGIWILVNVYILIKYYLAQCEILNDDPTIINELPDLQLGWSILSRMRDTSDVEWSSFKYFIDIAWPYLIIQSIVNEIIRRKLACYLKYWYIVSSLIFTSLYMGYRQVFLILIQPLVYSIILCCGGKKCSIWITSVILLASYNSVKYKSFFWTFLDDENLYDEQVYLILFCMPWIELRCISYCIDYVDTKKEDLTNSKLDALADLLSYSLYMPLLYLGPNLLYEDFKKSLTAPHEKQSIKFKKFVKEMLIYLTYMFLLDLTLHYVYFYAMHANIMLIRQFPALALCGAGLWMGVLFQIKYVIAYGTTSTFARLDNMETPPTPRCVARIHVYSHMWKYFDVGLYKFLVRYIYRPSLEFLSSHKMHKTYKKMLASLVAFSFIMLWHGTITRIYIWTVANYLCIVVEYLAKDFSTTAKYKWFKENVLKTEAMETRFCALLCVPLLLTSILSNFFLFAGTDVGGLFVECFYYMSITDINTIVVTIALYTCCIVSMALQDVPSRTDCKRYVKCKESILKCDEIDFNEIKAS